MYLKRSVKASEKYFRVFRAFRCLKSTAEIKRKDLMYFNKNTWYRICERKRMSFSSQLLIQEAMTDNAHARIIDAGFMSLGNKRSLSQEFRSKRRLIMRLSGQKEQEYSHLETNACLSQLPRFKMANAF